MKQIHESNIEVLKIKFNLEDIQVTYNLQGKDPEEIKTKIHAGPHPDLLVERHTLKKRLIELLILPPVPEGEGWKWEDRILIEQVEFDPDKGTVKFVYWFKSYSFSKPCKCTTGSTNDITIDDQEAFLSEVRLFVTGDKRAQSDMFHQQERERRAKDVPSLNPAPKLLAEGQQEPAEA